MALLAELGQRLAAYRLGRNWTQGQLADAAGVSKRTISRLEGGESTQLTNLLRVLRALGLLANVDGLVPAPVASPLEQFKRQGRQRRRASSRPEPAPSEPWSWGDEGGDA